MELWPLFLFLILLAINAPVAFAIASGALLFFLLQQGLPLSIFAQRLMSSSESFPLLAIPMFVSFKHGFVRHDIHFINFVCFVALAIGLFFLQPEGSARGRLTRLALVLPFLILWQEFVPRHLGYRAAAAESSGLRATRLAWRALSGFASLRAELHAEAERGFPPERLLERDIRTIIGDAPVASLSVVFAGAALDGLNLQLYPMVQRMGA